MTAAIVTEGLSKNYGPTRAVVDLDLRVESGECFGFLGPNGAGKTTTIRLLLGLQRPTRGGATVLGHPARADATEVRASIGYLPGDLALFGRMTAHDHIAWFARARAMADTRRATELVERFDVVVDRPAHELSKGNRQKVGLVLAFMHRPDLLILDEPTSGLDPLMQEEFEQLVAEEVADGRTVFLSSHELDEVQRLAHRVGLIKDGRLHTCDTVEHLRASAPLRIEARLDDRDAAERLARIPGVRVVHHDEDRVALEVTGEVAPVLRALAELAPTDLVARHADLDELFRDVYREPVAGGDRA